MKLFSEKIHRYLYNLLATLGICIFLLRLMQDLHWLVLDKLIPFQEFAYLVVLFFLGKYISQTLNKEKGARLAKIAAPFFSLGLLLTLALVNFPNIFNKYIDQQLLPTEIVPIVFFSGVINFFLPKPPRRKNFITRMFENRYIVVILLVAILLIHTWIKLPYFNNNFTGEHTMKYSAYVEPALGMVKNHNPFWYQCKYLSNTLDKPDGVFKVFTHLPLYEWGLSAVYKLTPFFSTEISTRLFTNLIGVLTLAYMFKFLSRWIGQKTALLATLLTAINPIFVFTNYVTVEDNIILLFSFISLNLLSKEKQQNNRLFWAGLVIGIAVAMKASALLIAMPILIGILVWNNRRDKYKATVDIALLLIMAIIPTVVSKTSIWYLPSDMMLGFANLTLWIICIFVLYRYFNFIYLKFFRLAETLYQHPINLASAIIVIIMVGLLFLKVSGIASLFGEFVTDKKLLFNSNLYHYMIIKQFIPYMGSMVFWLGIVGLSFLWFSSPKERFIGLVFIFSSTLYWILTSKVMFFHNYYTAIIMISFCILAAIAIKQILTASRSSFLQALVLISILLIIWQQCSLANNTRLSIQRNGFEEASAYLHNNLSVDELYIDEGYTLALGLKADRKKLDAYSYLERPEIKQQIASNGFTATMQKYGIKYIVSTSAQPEYDKYVNMLTEQKMEDTAYRRSDNVLSKIDPNYEYFSDYELRDKLIETYNIRHFFHFEQKIGDYYFFSIY